MSFTEVTAFMFDWGGFFGLRVAGEHSDYFDRLVLANTKMPLGDGNLEWFYNWRDKMRSLPEFPQGEMVQNGVRNKLPAKIITAYDAPYPDESYKTGPTAFTLINPVRPDDPPIAANLAAWDALADWEKPVLTLYADLIAKTAFSPTRFHNHMPGARGQPHYNYPNRSFYFVEDETANIATRIVSFIESTPIR